jgi:hypothetical protein
MLLHLECDYVMEENSVVIINAPRATIRGGGSPDIEVMMEDDGSFGLLQEGDMVALSRDEAEALFLVLDTMLHADQE